MHSYKIYNLHRIANNNCNREAYIVIYVSYRAIGQDTQP